MHFTLLVLIFLFYTLKIYLSIDLLTETSMLLSRFQIGFKYFGLFYNPTHSLRENSNFSVKSCVQGFKHSVLLTNQIPTARL